MVSSLYAQFRLLIVAFKNMGRELCCGHVFSISNSKKNNGYVVRRFKQNFHIILVFLGALKTPKYSSDEMLIKTCKSRKENPQKLTQLSSRSHPRHLVGKRTAQKDITIDTTSDSQVNSNFPNRWSPASLTFNNYFYLFCYLYIT